MLPRAIDRYRTNPCSNTDFDTTRAIAQILFSGTALRYRDIRWIFSHGGGTAPYLAERLVRAPGLNKNFVQFVPDGVMAELHRFYYDVAQVAYPPALAALTRFAPISQILWGTDYPFRSGHEYVKALGEYGFSADDLRKINRENALTLLPRWRGTARRRGLPDEIESQSALFLKEWSHFPTENRRPPPPSQGQAFS